VQHTTPIHQQQTLNPTHAFPKVGPPLRSRFVILFKLIGFDTFCISIFFFNVVYFLLLTKTQPSPHFFDAFLMRRVPIHFPASDIFF